MECTEAEPEELKANKKFWKENQLVFKVVFDKRAMIKGSFKNEDGFSDESDEEKEETVHTPLTIKDLKPNKTWYFNCGL